MRRVAILAAWCGFFVLLSIIQLLMLGFVEYDTDQWMYRFTEEDVRKFIEDAGNLRVESVRRAVLHRVRFINYAQQQQTALLAVLAARPNPSQLLVLEILLSHPLLDPNGNSGAALTPLEMTVGRRQRLLADRLVRDSRTVMEVRAQPLFMKWGKAAAAESEKPLSKSSGQEEDSGDDGGSATNPERGSDCNVFTALPAKIRVVVPDAEDEQNLGESREALMFCLSRLPPWRRVEKSKSLLSQYRHRQQQEEELVRREYPNVVGQGTQKIMTPEELRDPFVKLPIGAFPNRQGWLMNPTPFTSVCEALFHYFVGPTAPAMRLVTVFLLLPIVLAHLILSFLTILISL